jgi:hypothetical protein
MPVTKNPDYYLWVGALFKWAARHKGFVAGLCVGIIGLTVIWNVTGRSPVPAPPPVLTDRTTSSRAPNSSEQCPGKFSPLTWLTEDKQIFNPYGCYVYWKPDIVGTIVLSNSSTEREITAGPSPPAAFTAYEVRAKNGKAAWQYLLCLGPKKDMTTNDCS